MSIQSANFMADMRHALELIEPWTNYYMRLNYVCAILKEGIALAERSDNPANPIGFVDD